MRTIETVIYKFDELSKEAKEFAIEEYKKDEPSYEWWTSIYDDASNIGLEITDFDIEYNNVCRGNFINSAEETAELIMKEHGNECDTFITAKSYLEDRGILVEKYSNHIETDRVAEENYEEFDYEIDELDEKFKDSLLVDYKNMLKEEYKYLTSEEHIIEEIKSTEYEFTIDGKMYNE